MKNSRRSDRQLFLASGFIILATISLFIALAQLATAAIFPAHPLTIRVVVVGLCGVILLALSSLVLRDKSVLWQIPLQTIAVSFLAVSVGAIVSSAFNNWRQLFSFFGYRAAAVLATGASAAWIMHRLQLRFLPRQDA